MSNTAPEDITIRTASEGDVDDISRLAHRLKRTDIATQRDHNGFLVPYDAFEYQAFVNRADFFYVLRVGANLAGFLLAHSSQRTRLLGGEVYEHIDALQRGSYIVVRQIAIAPEFVRKGFAQRLYKHLFEVVSKSPELYTALLGFIWKSPANAESQRFHRKMGWKELGTYRLSKGNGEVGIWRYSISRNANAAPES